MGPACEVLYLGNLGSINGRQSAKKAKKNLIKWTKRKTALPIMAIGGINNRNYKSLIKDGVNYLAISSYIWNNPRLKPKKAIRNFN